MDETRRYYLVRTPPELVKDGVAAYGWSDIDFSTLAGPEEAVEAVRQTPYYHLGRSANQIRRFMAMTEGDVVLAPLPGTVTIGLVEKDSLFHNSDHLPLDRANQRRVAYLKDDKGQPVRVTRNELSDALNSRIRVRGVSVNDITEFKAELDRILASGGNHAWSKVYIDEERALEATFKRELFQALQAGRTSLGGGGVGLEHLVKELLEVEGYTAEVLGKKAFSGWADADIKASRDDRCVEIDLLVQVKHHSGGTDDWGLRQLQEIRRLYREYDSSKLVLVTSGTCSEELQEQALEADVKLIDGEALVEWIYDALPRLSTETKRKLGIVTAPRLL